MRSKIIVFALVTVLSNGVHAGDIFRCVAANGDVMFTNMACPANSRVQHVASYEPVADTPVRAYDANADAAAASAWEAREAARQAKEAAYQAEAAAYEQAQAAQSEQSADGTEYYEPAWFAPFYPQFGSRFHGHHHHPHQGIGGHSAAHSSHHAMPAPHVQATAFAFHR